MLNHFDMRVDTDSLNTYPRCEKPYIAPAYAGHEDTHMVVFNEDGNGLPGYGWVMRGPNVITFAPTLNNKVGIWSGARNNPMPDFPAVACVDDSDDASVKIPRILSMVSRGASLGRNGRPLVEKAHYIPRTQALDGKSRMWMRDKLFGVRFVDGSFSVYTNDNGRTLMSDWVEGKPWECGEEIAEWALEHCLWIDKPKVTFEKRDIYAASDAKMQENPLYGIF